MFQVHTKQNSIVQIHVLISDSDKFCTCDGPLLYSTKILSMSFNLTTHKVSLFSSYAKVKFLDYDLLLLSPHNSSFSA